MCLPGPHGFIPDAPFIRSPDWIAPDAADYGRRHDAFSGVDRLGPTLANRDRAGVAPPVPASGLGLGGVCRGGGVRRGAQPPYFLTVMHIIRATIQVIHGRAMNISFNRRDAKNAEKLIVRNISGFSFHGL